MSQIFLRCLIFLFMLFLPEYLAYILTIKKPMFFKTTTTKKKAFCFKSVGCRAEQTRRRNYANLPAQPAGAWPAVNPLNSLLWSPFPAELGPDNRHGNKHKTARKKNTPLVHLRHNSAFQSWSEKVKCLTISLLWNPNAAPQAPPHPAPPRPTPVSSVTCPAPGSLRRKTTKQIRNKSREAALAHRARNSEFKFRLLSSLTTQHSENFEIHNEQHQPSLWF